MISRRSHVRTQLSGERTVRSTLRALAGYSWAIGRRLASSAPGCICPLCISEMVRKLCPVMGFQGKKAGAPHKLITHVFPP